MGNQICSILILCESLEGGLGQAALAEANYLSSVGWRVTLSAPAMPDTLELSAGVAFAEVSIPAAIKDFSGVVASVFSLRQRFKFSQSSNLIHVLGLRSFVIARLAFPKTPVVVTFLGGPPDGWIRRMVFRFFVKISAGAITVAPVNIPGWQHWWHWSPYVTGSNEELWENGKRIVDRTMGSGKTSEEVRSLTLGWLGRFEYPKRPDKWLAVLAQAQGEGIQVRGVMAGDGPLLAQMRQEALRMNLDVDFLGWQPEHASIFGHIDALLTWSDSEGVPLVLQEAIWAGIPCLTNNLPGPAAFLGPDSLAVIDESSSVDVIKKLIDPHFRSVLQVEQLERLNLLLAEGRAEQKFAVKYQHLAVGER